MISRNVKCFWREKVQELFRQLRGTAVLIDWNVTSVTLSLVKLTGHQIICLIFIEVGILLFVVYLLAAREILVLYQL